MLYPFKFEMSDNAYMEIGLKPTVIGETDSAFIPSAVIVVGSTHMLLTAVELANFFMAVREYPRFEYTLGDDEYLPSIKDEFTAHFTIDEYGDLTYEIVIERANGNEACVGLISDKELEKLLINERFINNQLHRIERKVVKCENKLSELHGVVHDYKQKCEFANINSILMYDFKYEYFAGQMLANHLKFFLCTLNRHQ